ncbi:MAG: HEAT repeat domain-containing protein [Acidobacteria bacterium]|nr:HEAT repeat domain-containing protein [Acidobacteriota bacterium]
MKKSAIRILTVAICMVAVWVSTAAQDQAVRRYTKADFVKVEGGSLGDRVDRAFRQSKSSGQGETVWLAWHFRARDGVSYSPFGSMNYFDNGIRLEKRDSPNAAAIFLLVDATGSAPKFQRLTLLNLDDPYVFEDRPVYWLGDIETAQSIDYLEKTFLSATMERELSRGALRAVSVHEGDQSIALLRKFAGGDGDTEVRKAAVTGLARVRTPAATDVLIDLYNSAGNDDLKREIINGLSRSSEPKAADKLKAIAKGDPDPKLRQRAIQRMVSRW